MTSAFAQQENEQMQQLLDKALLININVKIVTENEKAGMSFQAVKLTIPGKPVVVQLKGKNINVTLMFTPYTEEKDKQVLLVVQGQTWLQEAATGQGKYLTSLKSIPVNFGEKIRFYPLGVGETGAFNIQLEIEIFYYKDYIKKNEKPLPKDDNSKEKTPDGSS
jgi:hypothetical protein